MCAASRPSPWATSGITCAYCATDTECDAAVEMNVPLHPPGTLRLDFRKHAAPVNAHAHQPSHPPSAVAEKHVRGLLPQSDAKTIGERRLHARKVALAISVIVQCNEQLRTNERVEVDRVAERREDVRGRGVEAFARKFDEIRIDEIQNRQAPLPMQIRALSVREVALPNVAAET